MKPDLVQIHHAAYQEDLPFWISLTRDREPVLEVGCGHGRVTLPLLRSGRRVVGVEREPGPLDFLRAAVEELPESYLERVSLVEADFLAYQPQDSFGAVIIPCNTVSTFSRQGRKALFQKAHSILDSGGLLAASLPNPVQMLDQLAALDGESDLGEVELETSFRHPLSGNPIQVSSRISAAAGTEDALRWDWIYDQLYPDGAVERTQASTLHYPIPPEVYRAELLEMGFRSIVFLGDFEGSPYQADSPYLIITCCR